ncbi:MAG TPA: methyltransferase domain-containing protein [Opitutus sp.]|nr:methyltransferase domain-containing protein [Opitutus sp.]
MPEPAIDGDHRALARLRRLWRRLRGTPDPTLLAAQRHRSFDAMAGILGWMLGLVRAEFPGFRIDGASALEIGTGKFLAHAVALRVCGNRRVVTIDKYRQLVPAAVRAALDRPVLARRFLSGFVAHDDYMARWRELQATGFALENLGAKGIEYRAPLTVEELAREPDRFDLIFSYTVLEHVPPAELPSLLAAADRLLAPGGIAVHFVDLEDHLDPTEKPFAFLEAGREWRDDFCGERGNRQRFSEWRKLLTASAPLDWRFPYVAVRHDAALPARIDPAVQAIDEEDLRTTAFVAVAQKPGERDER